MYVCVRGEIEIEREGGRKEESVCVCPSLLTILELTFVITPHIFKLSLLLHLPR